MGSWGRNRAPEVLSGQVLMVRTPNQAQGQQAQNLETAPLQLKEEDGLWSRMVALRRAAPPNGENLIAEPASCAGPCPGQGGMSGTQLWGPPAARRCGSLCQAWGSVSRSSSFEPCLLALGKGASGYWGRGGGCRVGCAGGWALG